MVNPWFKFLNVKVGTRVVFSDDFFKTEKIVSLTGIKFYLTESYLFVMEAKEETIE